MTIPRFRTEDGTSYCSSCDSRLEGISANCPNCGKTFDEEKDATTCVSCGTTNLLGSISCMKCGEMIKARSIKPLPPPPPPEISPETEEPAKPAEPKEEEPAKPEEPVAEARPEVAKTEDKPEKRDIENVEKRRQSLWELSEPFEKVIRSRRRRLAKINSLLESAKQRLATLEGSDTDADSEERAELEEQIQEIMEEKEEIVRIEEGIAEMERIYRNLLALQETELEKKQEALRVRLSTFEEEIEKRDKERSTLVSREKELKSKEMSLQAKIRDMEQREMTFTNQEREVKDKLRALRKEELDMMKKKFMGEPAVPTQKGWPGKDGEVGPNVVTDGQASEELIQKEKELNLKITELEGELKKLTGEREKLKEVNQSLTGNTRDVKKILKILDDLLERLPDEEIKRFADSESFRLYEKVLEYYEL